MLFKNFVPTVLAAYALLAPTVLGKHMTLRKYPTTTCEKNGGPYRIYMENECATLYETDHGIEPSFTGSGCTRKSCLIIDY